MQPDPQPLLNAAAIRTKPIGFNDAPDTTPFRPLVGPQQGRFEEGTRAIAFPIEHSPGYSPLSQWLIPAITAQASIQAGLFNISGF